MTESNELQFEVKPCENKNNKLEKKNAYKVGLLSGFQSWTTKLKFLPTQEKQAQAVVVDIYSLNYELSLGQSTSFTDNKKNKKIIKELNNIPKEFYDSQQIQNAQILLVLDIKTKEQGYCNKEAIEAKELEFLSLFHEENKLNFIQEFANAGLQYILMEGSLKADLLEKGLFETTNEEHLKSKTADFCQLVEFMINAFKRGETVVVKNKHNGKKEVFNAADYVKKVAEHLPEYQPSHVSHTIYPKQYHYIATQGIYTKAMRDSGLFKIANAIDDKTGIVQMKTEKMGI